MRSLCMIRSVVGCWYWFESVVSSISPTDGLPLWWRFFFWLLLPSRHPPWYASAFCRRWEWFVPVQRKLQSSWSTDSRLGYVKPRTARWQYSVFRRDPGTISQRWCRNPVSNQRHFCNIECSNSLMFGWMPGELLGRITTFTLISCTINTKNFIFFLLYSILVPKGRDLTEPNLT